jgi:sterol desaturase/sphingolipid hydroxylase (fatty acid hydroxylase superfamily)
MLISYRSFKNFIIINAFLFSIGIVQHNILLYKQCNYIVDFFLVLFIFLIRNYSVLKFIDQGVLNKPLINTDITIQMPKEKFKYEFHYYVLTTTAIESITHIFIKNNYTYIDRDFNQDIILFIPISFIFEIIFDFFHYTTHRLLHSKYLYKYIHKVHHTFAHPISIIAYYQDPLDLIITNSVPTILSLLFIKNISYRQFNIILIYKTFIEISGHSGKTSYPTCCFSQFMWLPKLLQIELYTEDHDLHHSLNNCNYSKRFSLWDKIFNTYKSQIKKQI